MKAFVLALAALAALVFASVAAADVSKLKGKSWREPPDFRKYDVVWIEDFSDDVDKKLKDEAENVEYHEGVVKVGRKLADRVAERLVESKAFARVERVAKHEPGAGDGLVIGGKITEYRDANIAGLYLGVGTGSRVRCEAWAHDANDPKVLGALKGVFATSFIPGVANLVQTANRFVEGLSLRISDEILIAKGAKFREETGRQGRLREKYTN
ncbi:MAG TPA: hypothetical protein VFL14_03860 [Xanthomonadales bacterium]|nr:hypothetical protein [Xanthomonadales bacterium]